MKDLENFIYERVQSGLYESKSKWAHPILNFKRLAYEIITWLSYKDLIRERQVLKWTSTIDYLNEDERKRLEILEKKLIALISNWLDLKSIKALKNEVF